MSHTTVKAIWPGEKHTDLEILHNSWGSAPRVWKVLIKKYYGDEHFLEPRMLELLWPRWQDLSIPEHQRAVLMMTYDRAYVTKKDYARAARDIREFLKDFPIDSGANHWPRLAEIFESDPDIPAIGLYCTSVSEDPFDGVYNEKTETYELDWGDCYDLYEELDSLKCEE